jgi:DNA phosphorothioation-associated putative methyltransferase
MQIHRHRTAIRRYTHSRPIATALTHGLIGPGISVFDYGCGRGEDVQLLQRSGIDAEGWDPFHRPDASQQNADVVNLGYVLNVIEDLGERQETLRRAFDLAKRLLVVSVRVDQSLDRAQSYADGVLTTVGSFQKLYSQAEFRDYLEAVLGVRPMMAALGIAYVFKDPEFESSYLARRVFAPSRPSVDALGQFSADPIAKQLVNRTIELGRFPLPVEFSEFPKLEERFGPAARLERLVRATLDADTLAAAQSKRREDILTYLAMVRLRGLRTPPLRRLPAETQADVKALWPSYSDAIEEGDRFLFSIGQPDVVRRACASSSLGKKLPTDLYIHTTAEDSLPALLRVLIFAAKQIVGDVEYNVVKIASDGRKISFLQYSDFDRDPHPALVHGVRVYLPTAAYSLRDFRDSENPPILHRKDQLLETSHPKYSLFERLTRAEERHGLLGRNDIGFRREWAAVLRQAGLTLVGHSLRRAKAAADSVS